MLAAAPLGTCFMQGVAAVASDRPGGPGGEGCQQPALLVPALMWSCLHRGLQYPRAAAPLAASLLLLQGDGPIPATDTGTPSPNKGRQSTGDITKSTRQLLVKAQDQLRREQGRGTQPGPRTGVQEI